MEKGTTLSLQTDGSLLLTAALCWFVSQYIRSRKPSLLVNFCNTVPFAGGYHKGTIRSGIPMMPFVTKLFDGQQRAVSLLHRESASQCWCCPDTNSKQPTKCQ